MPWNSPCPSQTITADFGKKSCHRGRSTRAAGLQVGQACHAYFKLSAIKTLVAELVLPGRDRQHRRRELARGPGAWVKLERTRLQRDGSVHVDVPEGRHGAARRSGTDWPEWATRPSRPASHGGLDSPAEHSHFIQLWIVGGRRVRQQQLRRLNGHCHRHRSIGLRFDEWGGQRVERTKPALRHSRFLLE